MTDSLGPKVAPTPAPATPAEPAELPPAERIGARGHENDPEDFDPKELPPATPDLDGFGVPTVHSEEYLKENSTKPVQG